MRFMVSSHEKPENSPLYSVHTDLDSFILCNDESIDEPEPEDRDANNRVEPTDFNIMATLDLEENEEETLGQCTETETQSNENKTINSQLVISLKPIHNTKRKTLHTTMQTPYYNIAVKPTLGWKIMLNRKTIRYGE